jgi:hypothetical protein
MASPAQPTPSPARKALCAAALALLACTATLLPAPALGASSSAKPTTPAVDTEALFRSRLLWATIDVCNAKDQPDTLGVRGSMPGDGHAHDTMYMRFRLQYMNSATKHWTDTGKGSSKGFASVGSAATALQGGSSFELIPVAGHPASTLRGVVTFQWRRGTTVVAQTSRFTSAGRHGVANSDPPGYSAATCLIG